jgi:hypothetical protein
LSEVLISEIFQAGYKGFYSKNTLELTPKSVNDIHKRGGTVIGTSRGGHDTIKIVDNIEDRGINQVRFLDVRISMYSTAKPSMNVTCGKTWDIFPNHSIFISGEKRWQVGFRWRDISGIFESESNRTAI